MTEKLNAVHDGHRTNTNVHVFLLTMFAGVSQQSSDTSGSLITQNKSVGNFIKLQLVKQTGEWRLKMMSSHPYTLKVIGETSAVSKRT